ncbi:MAG: 3-hydroxyacyl-CoA dehydrogenase [Actinobacteria bacterium]|nr:3-hydroxyacyl-CoA dehydrogenase [Actinomycetota bacterium]
MPAAEPDPAAARVAVVGAGPIGAGWAIAFARAGLEVALHDVDRDRLAAGRELVEARLADLREHGLLAEGPAAVAARVEPVADLADALAGAGHVQECAPERLELKRELFARLDALAPGAVLASSSSAITASAFAAGLAGRGRCLVAHPANPPFLLPVVEVVPAPFTEAAAVERTVALLRAAGMRPVRLRRELEGFAFNRLQGALLREAYRLVAADVLDVDEVDALVRDGLGRRWALTGPFENADLNVEGGIVAHAERMGAAYARMGAEHGERGEWDAELVARVAAQRRALLPRERRGARIEWRDRGLMELDRLLEGL